MSATVQGEWQDTIGRDIGYFDQRDTWLDCRGTLIIHNTAHFGFQVMLITDSHYLEADAGLGPQHFTTIQIDEHAWVANRAILYDCHLMPHAVVGAGAVVKGIVVPSWTLAEGNPAMLVAVWVDGKWRRLEVPEKPKPNVHG